MDLFYDLLIILVKALIVVHIPLGFAAFTTWVERKASALIQNRVGANRASILGFDLAGVFSTLVADPVKSIMKEDFVPRGVSPFLHALAPFLAVFPVILSFAVLPFGPPIEIGNKTISLQLANLNVGILFAFAMGSLAVYGTVLAGWVGNNKFSLFGGLRATAQMISYEVTMGMSLLGVIVLYQTLDLNEIVRFQGQYIWGVIPMWGIILNPLGALLFFISMMAETKRAPFDLPESESEIVAGYFTEYSGFKFILFWLGEFAEVGVAAAFVTVMFLGGWQVPFIDLATLPSPWGGIIGAVVFLTKIALLCTLQVIIRWTLPRFRYDQLMNLCWKIMLPLAIANLVVTTAIWLYIKGA